MNDKISVNLKFDENTKEFRDEVGCPWTPMESERKKYCFTVKMQKGTWNGLTKIEGDRLVCAALIMNLIVEGIEKFDITLDDTDK
jgi:hypothetical protein